MGVARSVAGDTSETELSVVGKVNPCEVGAVFEPRWVRKPRSVVLARETCAGPRYTQKENCSEEHVSSKGQLDDQI